MQDIYVARITQNNQGWERPSGIAKLANKQSFFARHGFHFDEWLFRKSWIMDNFQYGFIRGVHKLKQSSYTREGKFDSILYTIESRGESTEPYFRYVGQIRNVECLSKDQIKESVEAAKSMGWLKEMQREIKKIGGDIKALTQSNYRDTPFNVRFNPSDLKIFNKPIFAEKDNLLRELKNFDLFELSNNQRLKILHPILHLI